MSSLHQVLQSVNVVAHIDHVKFLDKLESVVDYRSTCRVLDLI